MKLKAIATVMRSVARSQGRAAHILEHGLVEDKPLTLTLFYVAGQWTLAVTRTCQHASEAERRLCREAFEIAETAEWKPTVKQGQSTIWYRWGKAKAKQLSFAPVDEENRPTHYQQGA